MMIYNKCYVLNELTLNTWIMFGKPLDINIKFTDLYTSPRHSFTIKSKNGMFYA